MPKALKFAAMDEFLSRRKRSGQLKDSAVSGRLREKNDRLDLGSISEHYGNKKEVVQALLKMEQQS